MLQFTSDDGYVFYLNHLISFLVCLPILFWACRNTLIGGSLGKEKFLHTAVSALLTAIFIKILLLTQMAPWWWGPIAAFSIGLGKEVRDCILYRYMTEVKKSLGDLLANFLGVLAISVLYFFSFLNAY